MNFEMVTGTNELLAQPRSRKSVSRPKSEARVALEAIEEGASMNISPVEDEEVKKIRSTVSTINRDRRAVNASPILKTRVIENTLVVFTDTPSTVESNESSGDE